jgi:hypothetical protein
VADWEEDHRKERVAKNELAYKAYNERRADFERQAGDDGEPAPFVCECGMADCADALMVTLEDWEHVHSVPNRFLIRTGHQFPDYERIVDDFGRHLIVEKFDPVE